MALTEFPIPTSPVSSDILSFMQSANDAAARTALGVTALLDAKQNLILPGTPMGALVINAAPSTVNTKSISVPTTFTQTVPDAGASWRLFLENTSGSDQLITLPVAYTFYSDDLKQVRTTFTIQAGVTLDIIFWYSGATIYMSGEGVVIGDLTSASAPLDYVNNQLVVYQGGLARKAPVTDVIAGPVLVKSSLITVGSGTGDIGTFSIPAWITRYRAMFSSAATGGTGALCLTAAGSLALLSASIRDAASGGGTVIAGPTTYTSLTAADDFQAVSGVNNNDTYTSPTLYFNSTVDSANAGTIRFYLFILPLL